MGNIVKGIKNVFESTILGGLLKKPKKPVLPKQLLQAPVTSIEEEEEEVNLGSDRARTRNKRASGRRQLMQPQDTGSSGTGLQL